MKETWRLHKLGVLKITGAAFMLSMLFIPGAFAQGTNDFALAGSFVPARCRADQLSLRHESEDAAMGGVRNMQYLFTNTSSSPCTLFGYPRFELLNRAGRVARGGRARNGLTMMGDEYKQPPRLVTIEPGKTATFWIHYRARGAGSMRKPCPIYRRFRITAPGIRRAFIQRDEIEVCGELEVSPVRAPVEE
jgi:Protein of unknown function (DUF4232)